MASQIRAITECSCNVCKAMCKQSPCMGTPEDIEKIIDAGYKDKLMFSVWIDQKNGNHLPAIMPIKENAGCVFQTREGLCELHASGLKPLEGKLAIHSMSDNGLRRTVGYTWISQKGIDVFEKFAMKDFKELKGVILEMIPYLRKPSKITSGFSGTNEI